MDNRQRTLALLAGLGVVILAVLHRQGKTPSITLAQESTGQSFTPFVFWMHQNPAGYFHHYPERIGVNTLPQPFQTEDIGLALKQVDRVVMDYAGCAQ